MLRDKGVFEEAETLLNNALEIHRKMGNGLHVANVELNLQMVFHKSGSPVDIEAVENATKVLQDAGDSRAEKGTKLLSEIEGTPPGGDSEDG